MNLFLSFTNNVGFYTEYFWRERFQSCVRILEWSDEVLDDLYTPKIDKYTYYSKFSTSVNFPFTPLMKQTQAASCRPPSTKVVMGRRGMNGPCLDPSLGTWPNNVLRPSQFISPYTRPSVRVFGGPTIRRWVYQWTLPRQFLRLLWVLLLGSLVGPFRSPSHNFTM